MLEYLIQALTPFNLLLALAGVVAGTIIGSLPGLTATMAVAVLVPITFTMPVTSALIMLGAIYTGAIYGGAYAAILLNTPGTPSAIATTLDGYPMAQRGDGNLAITLACIASVAGGLIGAGFLLLLSPPLAKVALAFGPAEYFWLALFGLTLIAALSKGNLVKGLIGGCFGLLLACVGLCRRKRRHSLYLRQHHLDRGYRNRLRPDRPVLHTGADQSGGGARSPSPGERRTARLQAP